MPNSTQDLGGGSSWGGAWPVLTRKQRRAQPRAAARCSFCSLAETRQRCSKMFSSRDALFCPMSPCVSQQRLGIFAATVDPRSTHGSHPLAPSLLQLCLRALPDNESWLPRGWGLPNVSKILSNTRAQGTRTATASPDSAEGFRFS